MFNDKAGKEYDAKRDREEAKGDNKAQFAWHVGGGVNYAIDNNIELNVINYKYNSLGKIKMKFSDPAAEEQAKLAVHTVSTGLTFKF